MAQCKTNTFYFMQVCCTPPFGLWFFSLCIEFDICNTFDTGNEGKTEDPANERQI